VVTNTWTDETFRQVERRLKRHPCRRQDRECRSGRLSNRFLGSQEEFLLRLLENPALLEHESVH